MEKNKKIQLHGLFRTGTNYAAKLLENNFFVKIHSEGNEHGLNKGFCTNWKHGPYVGHLLKEEYPMLIVTKSPYSWLVSCFNYWKKFPLGPEIKDWSFENFVKASPCHLEGSATVPFMFRAKNLMQYYWNAYYHWTSVRSTPFFVMQYEAILENAEETFTKLSSCFNLESRGKFENIENNILWDVKDDKNEFRLRNTPLAMDVKKTIFNRPYYNDKTYLENYSDDLLKYIKGEWDYNLASKMNYSPETPNYFEKLEIGKNAHNTII